MLTLKSNEQFFGILNSPAGLCPVMEGGDGSFDVPIKIKNLSMKVLYFSYEKYITLLFNQCDKESTNDIQFPVSI